MGDESIPGNTDDNPLALGVDEHRNKKNAGTRGTDTTNPEHKKSLRRSWRASQPTTKLTIVFTGIIAAATVIYCVASIITLRTLGHQLEEMRKSTKATQDAADAATSAANTAHDALVTSNRPWIGVEGVPVIQDKLHATQNRNELEYVVTITARNYGPSPALHVNINPISEIDSSKNVKEFLERIKSAETASCSMADLGVIENRSQTIVSGKPETVIVPPTGPTLFPNDRFAFPSDVKVGYGGTEDVSQYRLRMNGCVAYSDQFGKIHHTRFCFYTPRAIKDFVPPQSLVSCNIGTQTAD